MHMYITAILFHDDHVVWVKQAMAARRKTTNCYSMHNFATGVSSGT